MVKLSLDHLEKAIESQLLFGALCVGARGQVPDGALNQAFSLSAQTYEALVKQYTRRTNEHKTERMLQRCEKRLGINQNEQEAAEPSTSDLDGSSSV